MSRFNATIQAYLPQSAGSAAKHNQTNSFKADIRIWWREIDRTLLFLIIGLMVVGAIAVAAASPASARRPFDRGCQA